MTQRNPMNERYTGEHKGGSTRKSAASAKPVTKAASSVRMETKPAKKGFFSRRTPEEKAERKKERAAEREAEAKVTSEDRKEGRKRERAINRYVPDTPEFKALNRKRFIYSAVGLGIMVIAILLSFIMPNLSMLAIGVMVVGWIFFYISVRIDAKQLKPLRREAYERAERKAMKKAKHK